MMAMVMRMQIQMHQFTEIQIASIHRNTKCINSHTYKMHQFAQIQNGDPATSENVIKKGAALLVEICLHIIVEVYLTRSSTIKRDHAVLTK